MILGRFHFVSALVNTVRLNAARDLDLHAQIAAGEGIVAAVLVRRVRESYIERWIVTSIGRR